MEDILIFIQQQYLLVGLLAVLIIVLLRRESSLAGEKVSVSSTVQAMNAETAVLVDVRDSKDFEAGHIANSINIPHASINNSLKVLEKHKSKRIILTDKMGQHTGSVGRLLTKEGFDVCRLNGGMEEWKHQNLPLVK